MGAHVYQAQLNQAQPIRLLLVEDEFLISDMVAEDLSEQGFVVRAVANASDALSHLASAAVDILFTDVNLPGGMDGMTLARRAREMMPDLPVVYASGHANAFDLERCVPGSIFIRQALCAFARRTHSRGRHEGRLGEGRLDAAVARAMSERVPA